MSSTSTIVKKPDTAGRKVSSTGIPVSKLIVIFIGLLLGMLMSAPDSTIVATAMPTIASDLEGFSEISWLVTAYLLAQTIVAEIVSARERGKYMSIMGPMIGVATVLGPLLGGYLTDHASWRWIFYINVPIGVGVVVLAPLFFFVESRTAAPIMPLRLFKDVAFRVQAPLALLIGVAMFGAVAYLPTFLQLSLGASATMSGVLLLPLMGGLMLAAVTTGQLITRTGRYKIFPIMGTAIAAVGMYLVSLMDADTSRSMSTTRCRRRRLRSCASVLPA